MRRREMTNDVAMLYSISRNVSHMQQQRRDIFYLSYNTWKPVTAASKLWRSAWVVSNNCLQAESNKPKYIPFKDGKSNRRIIGLTIAACKNSDSVVGSSGRIRFSATETVKSCWPGRYKLNPVRLLTSRPNFNSPGPGGRELITNRNGWLRSKRTQIDAICD